jgi:hypothetical protein
MASLPLLLEMPPDWLDQIADAVSRKLEDQEHWVTAKGLAAWLGDSVSHVYVLRERGLPAHHLGGDGKRSKKLYFNLGEVAAWFESKGR